MDRALAIRCLHELIEMTESSSSREGREQTRGMDRDARLKNWVYTSPERLAAEHEVLFRELPILVGHASEVAAPGDFLTHDATGVPLLIVRGADGQARGFLNVCRHRGSRLVVEPRGHAASLSCRYHAWCYSLDGALSRVPRRECFPSLREEEAGLVPVPLAERAGLLWAVPGRRGTTFPLDLDAYLGPLLADFQSFGLEHHHVHRQVADTRRANWKLVMDAFLEGYHVRSLHRGTISRFFLDDVLMQPLPPHSRSIGARKQLLAARTQPEETWQLRELTTPFYSVFPNTILVFHPDWVSLLSVYPKGVGELLYRHLMLIPERPQTDAERAHWDKTFQLIEGDVFQREDLSIAESIQSGLGPDTEMDFYLGSLEGAVKRFHDSIEEYLAAAQRERVRP